MATADSFLGARELALSDLRSNLPLMDPLKATGMVMQGDMSVFLGTAFAFRTGQHYLTAAHCVGDLEPSGIDVVALGPGFAAVEKIERHPSADVALLVLERDLTGVEPFWAVLDEPGLGAEFFAFGYPEDAALGDEKASPKPRVFVGHYQRFYQHRSVSGKEYAAAELSIPAPAGLSGGPVFPTGQQRMVTALVAENHQATTLLESVERIQRPGEKHTIQYQSVISYGVAVRLDPLSAWLDEHTPSLDFALERDKRERDAASVE